MENDQQQSAPESIVICPSKDYLWGWLDSTIKWREAYTGGQRMDIQGGVASVTNQNEILGNCFFDLTCKCGNYVQFKTSDEIPRESIKCTLCEKVYLIYYTDPK